MTVDEAIELAKKYADKDSKNFVNAVLDSVLKGIEKKEDRGKPQHTERVSKPRPESKKQHPPRGDQEAPRNQKRQVC
jgi:hypothetical protein